MTTVLEKGTVSLPPRDLLRYAVDCESLMRDIGSFIVKDIIIPSDNGYLLVFYSSLKEEYNKDDCFFNIHYDKDLKFRFYIKNESNISKDMKYIILKY